MVGAGLIRTPQLELGPILDLILGDDDKNQVEEVIVAITLAPTSMALLHLISPRHRPLSAP